MGLKNNIIKYFRKKSLSQQPQRVNRKIFNINEIKTAGILFDATHLVSYDVVKNFLKTLNDKQIDVSVIGFVNSKYLIDHYLYRKGFIFLTKKDINWYGKPDLSLVKSFINKEFDVLFDLTLEECFPLKYIAVMSKAKLKVGKYSESNNYLDLMIDINKERNLIKQIRDEIKNEKNKNITRLSKEEENEIEKRVEIEIELNFLINQILYYLSLLKTKHYVAG